MLLEELCAVAARDGGEAFQIGSPDLFEGAILSADDAQCCNCKCLPKALVQPARTGYVTLVVKAEESPVRHQKAPVVGRRHRDIKTRVEFI